MTEEFELERARRRVADLRLPATKGRDNTAWASGFVVFPSSSSTEDAALIVARGFAAASKGSGTAVGTEGGSSSPVIESLVVIADSARARRSLGGNAPPRPGIGIPPAPKSL